MPSHTKPALILLFISSWFTIIILFQHFLVRRDNRELDKINELNKRIAILEQKLTSQQISRSVSTPIELPIQSIDTELSASYVLGSDNHQSRDKLWRSVRNISPEWRKRILVTGGVGFVGSHLVDKLMLDGHEVTIVDNLFTGRKSNIRHWIGHTNFELIHHDVINPLFVEVDQIYHLASPASPKQYMLNPIKTIKTNTLGTINMLGLAKRVGARILLASTSEIYGDPNVHPQTESYWGNVNTMGPRACYDEGKRIAEALAYSYHKQESVDIRVARIFNTYGPRMQIQDGRVVSNFIYQSLNNHSLTVHGNGHQTRSFQFVSDLVEGLVRLMQSNVTTAVNIGNPDEYSVIGLARTINSLIPGSISQIEFGQAMMDDPKQRRPDIEKAKRLLNWSPSVSLDRGLKQTIDYFREQLETADLS